MGLFITVEGGEFTGKTSVAIPTLTQLMEFLHIRVRVSREPGGTPRGEAIRQKIFTRLKEGADAHEAALLFNEARRIHLDEVILPFLGRKREHDGVMILDRYLDSTRVYQGLEGGVPLETLYALEKEYAYSFYPDLTLVLYFPEELFSKTFDTRRDVSLDAQERSRTVLDEGTLAHHLARQRHYLRLKDIAQARGEQRAIEYINAAVERPHVVRQIIEATIPHLQKSHALPQETVTRVHSSFQPVLPV